MLPVKVAGGVGDVANTVGDVAAVWLVGLAMLQKMLLQVQGQAVSGVVDGVQNIAKISKRKTEADSPVYWCIIGRL